MKQFSLEEYLKNPNRRIITKDGRKARIICIDREVRNCKVIVALVKSKDIEDILNYSENGICYFTADENFDLFFAL